MSCSNGSWQRQRLVVADAGMLAQLPAAPRRPDKAPQTVTAQPEYGDTVTVEPWWLAAPHAPSLETFSLSSAQHKRVRTPATLPGCLVATNVM